MAGRLEGKVAVVTGAARGQGEAEARRFVAEGASVLLTDVLDEEGEAVAASLGGAAAYRHLDVSSEEEWIAAVADAEDRFGPVTIPGFGTVCLDVLSPTFNALPFVLDGTGNAHIHASLPAVMRDRGSAKMNGISDRTASPMARCAACQP